MGYNRGKQCLSHFCLNKDVTIKSNHDLVFVEKNSNIAIFHLKITSVKFSILYMRVYSTIDLGLVLDL